VVKGETALTGLLQRGAGAEPEVIAAYAKRDGNGAVETVVAIAIDLAQMGRVASQLESKIPILALLVDPGGVVLTAYPEGRGWNGRDLGATALMRALAGRPAGIVASDSVDSVKRIWAHAPLAGRKGHFLVGIDKAAALRDVDREMTVAYAQLGLVAILVLIGAWLFGEHTILRPIRLLARHAERIGRGDLTTRMRGPRFATEFIPLTRALDSMAERLGERERELNTQKEHFRELATVDGLTGLANRRAFDQRLAAGWALAAELRQPIALLMVDVDHFKLYNDRYGHLDGDQALHAIAAILAEMPLENGNAARVGGEEFAVLLPATDPAAAQYLAERLRVAVAGLRIPHEASPDRVVTVSVGSASFVPGRGMDAAELLEAADTALYASTRLRNMATAYEPHALAKAG
jgi:diguanylate cyclase (GGDEF)-like protein